MSEISQIPLGVCYIFYFFFTFKHITSTNDVSKLWTERKLIFLIHFQPFNVTELEKNVIQV